jgi:sugar phosphate isomerase/epimerase
MHNFSLGFLTIAECDPVEAAGIASRCGYKFVGIRLVPVTEHEKPYELLTSKNARADFLSALGDEGVQVGDVELLRIFPHSRPEEFLPFLDVARILGAKRIVTISEDGDAARLADKLGIIAGWCEERDLFLELEPITWTQIRTLRNAAEVIRKVAHPRLGLLLDTLHFHRAGSTLEELSALGLPAPRLIHLCDAQREFDPAPEAMKRTAREARLFPGEGDLDLAPFFKLVSAETIVSIEVPNIEYRRIHTPADRAHRALTAARTLCGDSGSAFREWP